MGLVVLPLSVIDVSVGMLELALTVGLVVLPGASLLRAVIPGLGTGAVSVASLIPGAFVSGSVVQPHRTSLDQLLSIFGNYFAFVFVQVHSSFFA